MTNPLILNLSHHGCLNNEEMQVLEKAIARTRTAQRGEDVIREGDRPQESLFLLDGLAARYKLLGNGSRQITSLHIAGDFADLHSFFLKTMDHAVLALTPCRFGVIPHAEIHHITENHPHLARLLSVSIAIDGAVHRQWLAMTRRASAESRLAHLLCELFLRLQAVEQTRDKTFQLAITQAALGDVLGISTVHVNRTLQELRRNQLLTWHDTDNRVEIEDWDGLQKLAEFDPTYLNLQKKPR